MHDPFAMRLVQRVSDLNRVLKGLVERQGPLPEALGQRLAFQVLHHQEVDAVLAADIVNKADVRMAQRASVLASRSNRCFSSGSDATWSGRTLTATARLRRVSRAL